MKGYTKTILTILLIIILMPLHISTVQVKSTSNTHVFIDGHWEPNEWEIENETFNDKSKFQFGYTNNDSYVFFTVRYLDQTPSYNSCSSPFFTTCFDGIAIDFDINGDHTYMGTKTSPDDTILVGMYGNNSIDAYMQGIGNKLIFDTENNGTEDSFGRMSYSSDQYYTFECAKKINSTDLNGHDIAISLEDSIDVMIGYWNDLPPRTEVSGYSEWLPIRLHNISLQIAPTTIKTDSLPNYTFFLTLFTILTIAILKKYH